MKKNISSQVALVCLFLGIFLVGSAGHIVRAEDGAVVAAETGEAPAPAVAEDLSSKSSSELVGLAWAVSSKDDYQRLEKIREFTLQTFESEALSQGAGLSALPERSTLDKFKTMNNVATILFVYAEALAREGKTEASIAAFTDLIKIYPYAQAWDPTVGSYWSIKEKSQVTVDRLQGKEALEPERIIPPTKPKLVKRGTERVVDYTKYGTFSGIGTKDYAYKMANPNILANVVGEGIYPNTGDAIKNPRYKQVYKEGRLEGSHWTFANSPDLEAAYFKWVMAPEPTGIKLFFLGLVFEQAEMYLEAIKAYHALVVQFPRTIAWTYWQTPWYPAQAAVAKIKNILRQHPELKLGYRNAKVDVIHKTGDDVKNDIFIVSPGEIYKNGMHKTGMATFFKDMGAPTRVLGGKKVQIAQYANGQWRILVNGKPFIIKGVTYTPTKVCQSPVKGTIEDWMLQDINGNGRLDSPYDSWVDDDNENIKSPSHRVVGDFQLLKEMGTNVLRLYHHPEIMHKNVLRELYEKFGIMTMMGDFLGKYAIGSGATWQEGTDYENPEHRASMMRNVEEMVNEFKDEPYILMWLLGNENNYGVASNADKKPQAYYEFVNQVAKRIKELDPDRPVAICNGDTIHMDYLAQYAPEIDAYGSNVYRGDYGFGSFWGEVKRVLDRPALITEYGAPAYVKGRSIAEGEKAQASYHRGSWLDIRENAAGGEDGEGNAIGGVIFEWLDEWWKNYEPALHDTKADVIGPFAGGYYFEEWFGIVSQGDGKSSPFLRQPRKAYYTYKELWNQ